MEQDALVSQINNLFKDRHPKTSIKKNLRLEKKLQYYKVPKKIDKIGFRSPKLEKVAIKVIDSSLPLNTKESYFQNEAIDLLRVFQKENIFFRESTIVNKIIDKKHMSTGEEKHLKKIIKKASKNVFVVYGHNTDLKDKVCKTLKGNGYNPLTLDNRIVIGAETILGAIVAQAKECLTAVAICSADDFVKVKEEGKKLEVYKQPRPNVFFEIGYLYHCYEMDRVLILKDKDAKMCSDLDGVRYILDENINQLISSLNVLTDIKF